MPELGALFAAVAALLIIWAWQGWTVKVLQQFKAHTPGLFGPLWDGLISADTAIYNALRGWADQATQPFSALLDQVIATADAFIANPVLFARNVYSALQRLFTVTVPNAIAQAETTAQGLFQAAEADAKALLQGAEQGLAGLAAQLAGLGQRVEEFYQSAVQTALGFAQQVEAYAVSLFRQAEQDAAAIVGQEAERAFSAEQEIQNFAAQEAGRASAELQSWANEVRMEVGNIAQGLAGDVTKARADLEGEIGTIEGLIPGLINDALNASGLNFLELLGQGGLDALMRDVEALVVIGAAEVHRLTKDPEALRARFGPQIAAALAKVKVA